MSYAIKTLQTPEGPVTLDFDYIPAEPTTAQLAAYVPHVCSTCEWKLCGKCCLNVPEPPNEDPCESWAIGPIAHSYAMFEYYKDLYKKHYG